ncbi:MAG: FAD:protein FMN transferase [Pseudomonadota bacterium]|nr:FAD:protein FMN transferase [Pseudomonadota bacterium]
MRRRRFLMVAGAALMARPGVSEPVRWSGVAMGADVSVTLDGPRARAEAAIAEVRGIVRRMELGFSLYDPGSELSRLNRDGRLDAPSDDMRALLRLCAQVHRMTEGRFDPTVQPVWRALATGGDVGRARQLVGWDRVRIDGAVRFEPGQALTLNGIAQGYATDAVRDALARRGFRRVLVNIGEYAALGGGWKIGVEDPRLGLVHVATLDGRAVATSSPGAMRVGGAEHVLAPRGAASSRWSTVSVEADRAALADGLSTGLCLCESEAAVRRVIEGSGAWALLVDRSGQVIHIG